QNRQYTECVPVTRNVKQTVTEMVQEVKPVTQQVSVTVMKSVPTQVTRQVVSCTPQMVSVPPSCCNPCGGTVCQMVPTVHNIVSTVMTCVPEQQVQNVTTYVANYRQVSREVTAPVTTVEQVVRNVQVPVCQYQAQEQEVTVQVPVTRSVVEKYNVTVSELVPQ